MSDETRFSMKRIKFKTTKIGKLQIALLLIAILFIAFGGGVYIGFSSGLLVFVGSFILLFEFSRLFWYKTFVRHTNVWIIIRLNSFLPSLIKLKNIKKVYVNNTKLKITLKSGKVISFTLGWIERNDVDDLADILVENSGALYVNEGMHEDFIHYNN